MARAVLLLFFWSVWRCPQTLGPKPSPQPLGLRPSLRTCLPRPNHPTTKTGKEAVDINLGAYVELLRSDVRSQKIAILTQLMELTEAEDKAFWPLYRDATANCRHSATSASPTSRNTRRTIPTSVTPLRTS